MSGRDGPFAKQIVRLEGRLLDDGKVSTIATLECGHKITSDQAPGARDLHLGIDVTCADCMLAAGEASRPPWAVDYETIHRGPWQPHFRWKDATGRIFVELEEKP